jgi:hypothetical protein
MLEMAAVHSHCHVAVASVGSGTSMRHHSYYTLEYQGVIHVVYLAPLKYTEISGSNHHH